MFPNDEGSVEFFQAVREIVPRHPYFEGRNGKFLTLCLLALSSVIDPTLRDQLNQRQCECLIRVLNREHNLDQHLDSKWHNRRFPRTLNWLRQRVRFIITTRRQDRLSLTRAYPRLW